MTDTRSTQSVSSHSDADITTRLEACLVSIDLAVGVQSVPLQVELEYRRDRPFEVDLTFMRTGASDVTWVVGRDLLTVGLTTSTTDRGGACERAAVDIEIGTYALPGGDRTMITLAPPSHTVEVGLSTHELIQFVVRTEELVAAGTEGELITEADYRKLLAGPETYGGTPDEVTT